MGIKYDLAVIGGGPAGYVAAIRSAQLGANVAVIEKNKVGGTCLNVGCIPTKALLHSASKYNDVLNLSNYGINISSVGLDYAKVIERKNEITEGLVQDIAYLINKNQIDYYNDFACMNDATSISLVNSGELIEAEKTIIATGAVNKLPPVEGIEQEGIMDSTGALNLKELPESITIIGAGVIGVEMAEIFSSYGCQVTIIELLPHILDGIDRDCASAVEVSLSNKNVNIHKSAKVKKIEMLSLDSWKIHGIDENQNDLKHISNKVLISTGRVPNIDRIGLDNANIKTEQGRIIVNDKMQTSVSNIFAAGDVLGDNLYAHVAYHEGKVAAENALGQESIMNYKAIPKAIFTRPQVASVGLTVEEAEESGIDVITGIFPTNANALSRILEATEGFVKFVADKDFNEIVGLHLYCANASDLIVEGTLAISLEATLEDIASVIHVHPSISEALHEAALNGLDQTLHI